MLLHCLYVICQWKNIEIFEKIHLFVVILYVACKYECLLTGLKTGIKSLSV